MTLFNKVITLKSTDKNENNLFLMILKFKVNIWFVFFYKKINLKFFDF